MFALFKVGGSSLECIAAACLDGFKTVVVGIDDTASVFLGCVTATDSNGANPDIGGVTGVKPILDFFV